jgi:hypothetical protein
MTGFDDIWATPLDLWNFPWLGPVPSTSGQMLSQSEVVFLSKNWLTLQFHANFCIRVVRVSNFSETYRSGI